jgi:hypothetical protein
MAAVSERLVREFFELQGYCVNLPFKYVTTGRQKTAEEEIDLLILHPRVRHGALPADLLWSAAELKCVARAVVAVRGWHSERFYARTIEQSPDILRFASTETVRAATRMLGGGPIAKILCLPRLPVSPALRDRTLRLLKAGGVDGVLTFRAILGELVARVDVNAHYEKSDLLQTIRLLKHYAFLKDPQLELFGGRARKRT